MLTYFRIQLCFWNCNHGHGHKVHINYVSSGCSCYRIMYKQAITSMEGKQLRYRLKLKYGTHQQRVEVVKTISIWKKYKKRWEHIFDFSKPWWLPDWKKMSLWPNIYIYSLYLEKKMRIQVWFLKTMRTPRLKGNEYVCVYIYIYIYIYIVSIIK